MLSGKHVQQEEIYDDFSNNIFNDPEEETNDAEEFNSEFVNLEGARRRCH